jgi:hypothetical protein
MVRSNRTAAFQSSARKTLDSKAEYAESGRVALADSASKRASGSSDDESEDWQMVMMTSS